MARSQAAEPTPPPPTGETPTLAFIYDRHATSSPDALNARLDRVRAHIAEQGYTIGGWFIDTGDDALSATVRPAFSALCNTMTNTDAEGADKVCLVHDLTRLSHDIPARISLQRRIRLAGGRTCTTQDDDVPPARGTLASLHQGLL